MTYPQILIVCIRQKYYFCLLFALTNLAGLGISQNSKLVNYKTQQIANKIG